ncbi:unnamed protein product [Clonostachys solani]|uniref:Uncharacterized protein n=1 Tax=Clonostachys solani TaxID=160281 RepID=A0A9N9ZPJ0_9HYPO|nr:unnamed protein product [Clonostachys solani]
MSILLRSPVRTHTGSYQTIASNAPIGLLCFRDLFEQEDAVTPNKQHLESVLARDFRDLENGTERSKARQDVINAIMTRRSRYSKYQTDISQSWCITNPDKSQTVLFEGIRFMMFIHDEEWVRVPLSGRLEVRPATRNGRSAGEIVQRKMTADLTGFWQRRELLRKIPKSPHSAKRNASPTLPPYPELDGGPKLEAAPKTEVYGDVPPQQLQLNNTAALRVQCSHAPQNRGAKKILSHLLPLKNSQYNLSGLKKIIGRICKSQLPMLRT